MGSGSATPLWLGTVDSMCRPRYRFVWILRFEGTGLVWSFCHCGVLPLISLALHGRGRTRFAPPCADALACRCSRSGGNRFAAVWSAVGSGSATPLWLGTVDSMCRARYRFVWILRFEETGLVRSFGHCEWLAVIAKAVSALVPRSATALQRKTCRPGVGGRLMEQSQFEDQGLTKTFKRPKILPWPVGRA